LVDALTAQPPTHPPASSTERFFQFPVTLLHARRRVQPLRVVRDGEHDDVNLELRASFPRVTPDQRGVLLPIDEPGLTADALAPDVADVVAVVPAGDDVAGLVDQSRPIRTHH
jgi:hypothetical protein